MPSGGRRCRRVHDVTRCGDGIHHTDAEHSRDAHALAIRTRGTAVANHPSLTAEHPPMPHPGRRHRRRIRHTSISEGRTLGMVGEASRPSYQAQYPVSGRKVRPTGMDVLRIHPSPSGTFRRPVHTATGPERTRRPPRRTRATRSGDHPSSIMDMKSRAAISPLRNIKGKIATRLSTILNGCKGPQRC